MELKSLKPAGEIMSFLHTWWKEHHTIFIRTFWCW